MTPLHFAFVACNRNAVRFREDPSFIYRCKNMSAALKSAGHHASVFHLSTFPVNQRFDVVIFHRPQRTFRFNLNFLHLKRFSRQCIFVADVDDLIFDETFAKFSPGVVNGLVTLSATQKNYRANRLALAQFDLVTVSTAPLAAHIATTFPLAQVEILPNAVPLVWRTSEGTNFPTPKEPLITYFPGTRSHDCDFAFIAEPLERFLAKYPRVKLRVTGPLRLDITARSGQVLQQEKVPFAVYPEHFREAWVNLAPLELTPFNLCKSALKVMEAGYWNIPTVCTPTPDVERFIDAGALTAKTPADWFDRLELLLNPVRYQSLTDKLRERVLRSADVNVCAARLVQVVLCARAGKG